MNTLRRMLALVIIVFVIPGSVLADTTITAAFPSFTSTNKDAFQINGDASYDDGNHSLLLTPADDTKAGSVFWKYKVSLANHRSFSAYFTFRMGDIDGGGADGIVFALQSQSNTAGSSGGGLGFENIPSSLGVEFDTYHNPDRGDPDNNHIGIDINGSVNSVEVASVGEYDFRDSTIYHVWIDYDGSTHNLEVRLNDDNDRSTATQYIDYVRDLEETLGQDVYVGFTAATGASSEYQEIRSFYFNSDFLETGITPGTVTYQSAPYRVVLSASPDSIAANGTATSVVTATAYDVSNAVISGATINFTKTSGSVSPASGTTNGSGQLQTTFTAPTSSGSATVRGTADGGTYGETTITLTNLDPTFTGTPSISGTPLVGNTLSAADTGTSDPNNDTVTLSYQWKADGSNIAGAGNSTYVLTAAEAHKTITLQVTANDGHGGTATATTEGVAVGNTNPAFTGTPSISGTAAVSGTLSAASTGTSDADGDTVTLSYQWKADGSNIDGATASTFLVTAAEAHQTITLEVTASDGHSGTAAATTAGAAVGNTAPAFTGTPSISGTALVGNTLTAANTGTTDIDGDTVTLSYQWKANGSSIEGATYSTLALTSAQAHTTITVTVTADDGYSGTVSSTTAGVAVGNSAPAFSGTPSISGTALVGNTLNAADTGTTDSDGDTVTLSYQWKADGESIDGATASSLELTSAQAHRTITLTVTASDGHEGTVSTTTAGVLVDNTPPAFTGTPSIDGTPAVWSTLTAESTDTSDADGDTVTLSYQWKADGEDIDGATASSYTVNASYSHTTITLTVTADDGEGGTTSVTTAGVTMPNAAPTFSGTPSISGTAVVGNTLSAADTGTTDLDGDTVTLSYQWKADGDNIDGATAATFVITAAQAHQTITLTVTADDGHEGTASATTSEVPVENTAPAFTGTPAISGTALVGNTLTAASTGTTDADGDSVTLSYQWKADGSDISGANASTYVVTSAEAHQAITLAVTASDGHAGTTMVTTAEAAVGNTAPVFTGTPGISGTGSVGSTLTAANTGTSDADGDTVTLSYQWKADGSSISGATSSSFIVTSENAHQTITLTVTANDGHGGSTPATTAGVTVGNSAPTFTGTPGISGTALVGNTLSAANTGTSDADGDTVTLSYQWKSGGSSIDGATSSTFVVTADQAHTTITLTVTADDGQSGTASATTAGVAVGNTAPTFNSAPTISGEATIGATLSAANTSTTDVDGDSVTLSYQWKAAGSSISGATSSTFTVTTAQAHQTITLVVTANDGHGGVTSATTAGVGAGNAAPEFTGTPAISGTPSIGNTLTVINIGATDADGDNVTLSYHWKANGTNIAGAISPNFVLTLAQAHKTITLEITASDGQGGITVFTTAGVTVTNNLPSFTGTPGITGTGLVGNTLSATGTGTTDGDGDTVTLGYQWKANGSSIEGATSSSFVITADQAHQTITVTVTANDGNSGTASATTAGVVVENSAPSFMGTPSISGTPLVGNTLTAANTATTDVDGDTVTLSYQWKADGSDISGANAASFVVTSAQARQTITLAIGGNDGHEGTTSASTAGVVVANTAPAFTGTPSISGTPLVGNTLTAADIVTTDADEDTVTLSYQWKADGGGIAGATSSTFVLTTGQAHKTITLEITAEDGYTGSTSVTTAGRAVANTAPAFTGTPSISGTGLVGSTLSAADTGTTDADGDTVTLSYQWKADGDEISGATGSSFTVTAAQARRTITLVITADDDHSGTTSSTTAGVEIQNTAPAFSGTPSISGTGLVGSTLTAANTETTDADGDTPTLSYQWKAGGADISGANASTFVVTSAQAHQTITLTVTADDGHSGITSATTAGLAIANTSPAFSGTPAISGTGLVGSTLTAASTETTDADADTVTLSYQWKSDGSDISGANASTFVLTSAQAHSTITVVVTADDGHSGTASATTAGVSVENTAPVFSGTPSISGTALVGNTLSAADTGTTDADGDTVTLSWQWKADGAEIDGATSSTFVVTSAQARRTITVTVTANDAHSGTVSATTAGVLVQNSAPVFSGTPGISGTALIGSTLSATDTGTTDADDDTVTLSYQWKADNSDISGATSSSFVITAAEAHKTITLSITADDGHSGTASATTAGVPVENTAPVFSGTPAIDGDPLVGNTLNAANTATTDVDEDTVTLSYQWKADGSEIDGATASSFVLTSAEAHKAVTLEVTAEDGHGGTVSQTTSGVTVENSAPAFDGTPSISGTPTVGNTLSVADTGTTDADSDTITLTYQWKVDGSDVDGAVSSTFVVTSAQAHKTISVTVTADDGYGGTVSATTAGVTAENTAPTLTEGESTTVTMSEDGVPTAFSLTLHAADADEDSVTWSVSSAALHGTASLSGSGDSRSVSYVPAPNYNGSDEFEVQLDDGHGGTGTITVHVVVQPVNDEPVITEGENTTVAMSRNGTPTPFSLTLHATDTDNDTLSWSIDSQSAHGQASVSGTGASKTVSYQPAANYWGTDAFVVQVSDGHGGQAYILVNVTVYALSQDPVADSDQDGIPNNTDPDNDNDGIPDVQEIEDGTDSFDPGSALPHIGQATCLDWNSFAGWNILETINKSDVSLSITLDVYDIAGVKFATVTYPLPAQTQFDYPINDFLTDRPNTYGQVCISHNGNSGDVDGRMVQYQNPLGGSGAPGFVAVSPMGNGKTGTQHFHYNTYQPSLDPADSTHFVANFVELSNPTGQEGSGRLTFYEQDGRELSSDRVTLPAHGKRDIAVHELAGETKVGLATWVPDNSTQTFVVRLARYYYPTPIPRQDMTQSLKTEGAYGTGALVMFPLNTNGASAVTEIGNVLDQTVSVTIKVYAENGDLKESRQIELPPHASTHYIADYVLGLGSRGTITVQGSLPGSVLAEGIGYGRTPTAGITYVFGDLLQPALGEVLSGSYNTYLGQDTELLVVNPTNSEQTASVTLLRSDSPATPEEQAASTFSITLPAHGLYHFYVNELEHADHYGLVKLTPSTKNLLAAWVRRQKASEFVILTPLRD